MKAAIIGIEGSDLSAAEIELLGQHPPAGVILFRRNVEGAMPLARLMGDLREALPPEAVLLVDHEGGRVARLGPPDWFAHPAAGRIGALHATHPADALKLAWVTGALIGLECAEAGFDVVCAPVLDVLGERTTTAIGDRAYGADPALVAALGQSMADGLLAAGVQPVGKHAPGHGAAELDTHEALPTVDQAVALEGAIGVFTACAGLPWMMTAHIVYDALDPAHPATLSSAVLGRVVRGTMGFDGVLVSDDLAMGALDGSPVERAMAALGAGCDLAMHCSGHLEESRAVLEAVPEVAGPTLLRLRRARRLAESSRLTLTRDALRAEQLRLMGPALANEMMEAEMAASP